MRSKIIAAGAVLSSLLVIVIVFGNIVIVAQKAEMNGTWTARLEGPAKKSDRFDPNVDENDKSGEPRLHIEMRRASDDSNGRWSNSQGIKFSEISGLTKDQLQGGPANFTIKREAGEMSFTGSFADGNGSGTYHFVPDRGFFDRLQQMGFDFYKADDDDDDVRDRHMHGSTFEDRALGAFFINVKAAQAEDLIAANFGKLDVDDLFKAAIFHIDGKFMSEMKATGFPNLSMEDLVKARIFKIDANYVSQIRGMGYESKDFETLVKFRIFKVTPEFLNELRGAGLSNISAEDIVKCRIFNIDANYVREVRAKDPNASIEDIVKKRIGVGRIFTRDEF